MGNNEATPLTAMDLRKRIRALDGQISALTEERDAYHKAVSFLEKPTASVDGTPELPDLGSLEIDLEGARNHAERVMRVARKAGTFSVWQVAEYLAVATGSESPIKNIKSPVYETIRKHPHLFEKAGVGDGVYRYVGDDADTI